MPKFLLSLLFASTLLAYKNPTQPVMYDVNDTLLDYTLVSQHGFYKRLDSSTKMIIITYDKVALSYVHDAIMAQGGSKFVDDKHIDVIVDISTIPASIFDLFVFNRLQQSPFTLLMAPSVAFCKMFAYKEGHISVLFVDNKRIKHIAFARDDLALGVLLDQID